MPTIKVQIHYPYSFTVTSVNDSNGKLTPNQRALITSAVFIIIFSATAIALLWTSGPSEKEPVEVNLCRVQSCGQTGPRYSGTRIVGGQDAREDELPYQVAFMDTKGLVFCGGSMINDRWVLSAAHCFFTIVPFFPRPQNSFNLSVGVRFASEIKQNMMEVDKIWIHPNYGLEPMSKMYDIALVKTKKSIKESSSRFVSPICLPYPDLDITNATVGKVSGFGSTVEGGPVNSRLKTASIKLQGNFLCKNFYTGYLTFDPTSMICAGNLRGGGDTCQGDSGGPLAIRNENGSYVLRGITSHGRGCGRINSPGVYTKVFHYLDWVCEKMVDNGIN